MSLVSREPNDKRRKRRKTNERSDEHLGKEEVEGEGKTSGASADFCSVFGLPPLFDHLVSFLDLDGCLGLWRSSGPTLRRLWNAPLLRRMTRRLAHRPGDPYQLSLRCDSLSFPAWASSLHLHAHSTSSSYSVGEGRYRAHQCFLPLWTDPMPVRTSRQPSPDLVLFLPHSSPYPFADSLLVALGGGKTRFYALESGEVACLRQASELCFPVELSSGAVSPDGRMLVCSNAQKTLTILLLDTMSVSVLLTSIPYLDRTLRSQAFYDDCSFLTILPKEGWRLRRLSRKGPGPPRLESLPIFERAGHSFASLSRQDALGEEQPSCTDLNRACDRFAYRPADERSPATLLVSDRARDSCEMGHYEHALTIVRDPDGLARRQVAFLRDCAILHCLLHPSRDSAFVVVLTSMGRDAFAASGPTFAEEGEIPRCDSRQRGMYHRDMLRLAVYEIQLSGPIEERPIISPRFYIGWSTPIATDEYRTWEDDQPHGILSVRSPTSAQCSWSALTISVRASSCFLCPLSSDSLHVHYSIANREVENWATSELGDLFYFLPSYYHNADTALRRCTRHDDVEHPERHEEQGHETAEQREQRQRQQQQQHRREDGWTLWPVRLRVIEEARDVE